MTIPEDGKGDSDPLLANNGTLSVSAGSSCILSPPSTLSPSPSLRGSISDEMLSKRVTQRKWKRSGAFACAMVSW